jgi:DNA-binding response OmpR family regulator
MTHTILLVEDDEHIMAINRNKLTRAGYRILEAETLSGAAAVLETESPDLIVLDVMLPDGNGVNWCGEIRGGSSEPPVLFLSAKNETPDILDGFEAGGDDYLTKPYDLNILLARIKVLLEKASRVPQKIKKGSLTLDIVASRAFIDDIDLLLTPREFSLLLLLVGNEGKTVSAEALYEKAWNAPLAEDKNTLQATVSKLRRKIEPSGYGITTSRGQGYTFGRGEGVGVGVGALISPIRCIKN